MRTLALIKKEFLQFWRDPVLLVVVLWAFTFDVYLCARGFSLDIRGFPVAIYDMDRSQQSQSMIDHLHEPRFRQVKMISDPDEVDELLSTGQALMVVVIDNHFSRRLARGEPAEVQVILDGTNSSSTAQALGEVSAIFSQVSFRHTDSTNSSPRETQLPVIMRSRIRFNENMESSWSVGLTELFGVITMVAILLPAAAMVREKEYGTIEQLLVSPLRSWQVTLSKIVPMTLLVVGFTTLSLLAVMGAAFGLYPKGSMGLFLVSTAIYVYACAGLGMLLSTLAKNLSQVILMLTTVLVPIMFLSGTWAPPEAMPPALRWFTHISPLSYYYELGTGIFFRGWGLKQGIESLFWLFILGGGMFVVGTTRVGREFS